MSEQRFSDLFTDLVDNTDLLDTYQEFIPDVPDPAETLHAEFVRIMPYLYGNERLKAAQTLAPQLDGKTPDDFADNFVQDSPFIKRRVLELAYGETELSAQEIVLQAIREASDDGEADAAEEARVIEALADGDPDVTLEELYKDELDMFIQSALGVTWTPQRTLESEPAADYVPSFEHIQKVRAARPALAIGGVVISKPADIHKLAIPELMQPWEAPVQEVIAALESDSHVLVDSRRNSGKTHIFPGLLRERAPANWQITELTNNYLRGGEGFMGSSTSRSIYTSIAGGVSVEQAITDETNFHSATTPHIREAIGEPERRILILDEAQATVLDPKHREAGVLSKILEWATANDTQLVLINAVSDRRQVAEARDKVTEILGGLQNVNIEAQFDRPEYPRRELLTILGHLGVSKEVARWWATDDVATPLRSMRGVYLSYSCLSNPFSYLEMQDTRLRTIEQVKQLLWPTQMRPLFEELASTCAGSGQQLVALTDYFGLPRPDYKSFGYNSGVTPEDIR